MDNCRISTRKYMTEEIRKKIWKRHVYDAMSGNKSCFHYLCLGEMCQCWEDQGKDKTRIVISVLENVNVEVVIAGNAEGEELEMEELTQIKMVNNTIKGSITTLKTNAIKMPSTKFAVAKQRKNCWMRFGCFNLENL